MEKKVNDSLPSFPAQITSNEKLLGMVMEQVSDLVFLMKIDRESLSYTYMNLAAARYHNINREELYGHPIEKLVGKETAAAIEENYRHVINHKESYSYEDVVVLEQEVFYGKTILSPLIDENEEVTHVLAVTKDNTKVIEQEKELREVNATYLALLRNIPDAVLVTNLDGEIIDINAAFENLYGYKRSELSSYDYKFVPEDREKETRDLLKEAGNGNTVSGFETIRRHKDGHDVNVSITMAPIINRRNEVTAVNFMIRDITERMEAAKKIRQSEEKFQVIADHSDDLISVFNEKAKIIYSSPSHLEWLGFDVEGWTGEEATTYIHPEDRDMALRTFHRSRHHEESFQFRVRLLMQNGLWRWFECRGYPVQSGKYKAHFVLISRDVTTEVDYMEKLKEYAYYDYLTELPNRRLFEQSVSQAIDHADETESSFALFYLDGDNFKEVNDLYGHETGDEFLQHIGARLKETMRGRDAVGRLGGDEFGILVKYLDSEKAAREVAKRVQQKMSVPFKINGHYIVTTFSIGIAFYPEQASSLSELLRKADEALYRSKEQGKGLVITAEKT